MKKLLKYGMFEWNTWYYETFCVAAVKASSTVASSEGDEDEMDIDSDKEGEEGSTKIGKDGKLMQLVASCDAQCLHINNK